MDLKLKKRSRPDRGRSLSGWKLEPGSEAGPGLTALELLGGGVRYEAYLAHDASRQCLVVAKMLRPAAVNPVSIQGLRREFELLRSLNHPVLVRGFDARLDGGRPLITLEHLDGPRLSTLIRRFGPLPVDQLLPLALQLCSVLHYLHGQGVLHLDVKPKNVIMTGPPRLIDLSVAQSVAAAARLDRPAGTAGYMSPEQQSPAGPVAVGPGSDMWGLGATLLEAATGVPAGEAAPAGLLKGLPPLLTDALGRCLAGDPDLRPRPAELAARLEPLVDALPRRFPLTPPRPGMPARRR